MSHPSWQLLHATPDLMESDVHVWRFSLDVAQDRLDALQRTLSDDERQRAERYAQAERGRVAIVSRGTLRTVLAGYLGRSPAALAFDVGPHGKPSLVGPGPDLQFNVSHANDTLLVVVALDRPLGVDVEDTKRAVELEALVSRYFTSEERDAVAAAADARAAFFRTWVRKEAVLKARGTGFETPQAVEAGWQTHDLELGPTRCAALALPDGPVAVRCFVT